MKGQRHATPQVVLVGILALCGPGLFNALNGLGNAGSSSPRVAAIANGCLYCTFAVAGYFGGAAFNLLGPVPLFTLGGGSYAAYAICIYFSATYWWLAPVGGIVLGVGAGLFWTAQGSLMMAYATPQSRGRLISIFWIIFNLGGVLGGLLAFTLNYDNQSGGANPVSYFTMIVIMIVGAGAAPCVLAHPSRVVKEDGSVVQFQEAESALSEIWAAVRAFNDPFVRANLLFFFASNWFYTYEFSGFNAHQFTMRTRGLNSSLFWAAQMLAAWLFGGILDAEHASPLKRAVRGWTLVVTLLLVSLGWAAWNNAYGECSGGRTGWDKGQPCELDYLGNFPYVLQPMCIYVLLGAADAVYQNYAYWLMATAAGSDVRRIVMYSAVYKGVQSLGAGVAWLTDLNDSFTYKAQVGVTLILTLGACLPVLASFRFLELDHASKASEIKA